MILRGPKREQLLYRPETEDAHYQRRLQTKQVAVAMSDSARDHKNRQDELLRRNGHLRDQLMNLRRSMVEAKRIYFEENAQYEEKIHQRN